MHMAPTHPITSGASLTAPHKTPCDTAHLSKVCILSILALRLPQLSGLALVGLVHLLASLLLLLLLLLLVLVLALVLLLLLLLVLAALLLLLRQHEVAKKPQRQLHLLAVGHLHHHGRPAAAARLVLVLVLVTHAAEVGAEGGARVVEPGLSALRLDLCGVVESRGGGIDADGGWEEVLVVAVADPWRGEGRRAVTPSAASSRLGSLPRGGISKEVYSTQHDCISQPQLAAWRDKT